MQRKCLGGYPEQDRTAAEAPQHLPWAACRRSARTVRRTRTRVHRPGADTAPFHGGHECPQGSWGQPRRALRVTTRTHLVRV